MHHCIVLCVIHASSIRPCSYISQELRLPRLLAFRQHLDVHGLCSTLAVQAPPVGVSMAAMEKLWEEEYLLPNQGNTLNQSQCLWLI